MQSIVRATPDEAEAVLKRPVIMDVTDPLEAEPPIPLWAMDNLIQNLNTAVRHRRVSIEVAHRIIQCVPRILMGLISLIVKISLIALIRLIS